MIRIFLVFMALMLAGCFSAPVPLPPPEVPKQQLKDIVPDSELRCKARPSGKGVRTQRDVAGFIADLDEAGHDCRDKLESARKVIQGESP